MPQGAAETAVRTLRQVAAYACQCDCQGLGQADGGQACWQRSLLLQVSCVCLGTPDGCSREVQLLLPPGGAAFKSACRAQHPRQTACQHVLAASGRQYRALPVICSQAHTSSGGAHPCHVTCLLAALAHERALSAGGAAGLALPYRSQESSQPLPEAELEAVPPGPCRAILQRHRMMRSITSCAGPQPHASLALPAYVQMSSPIRRHGDLLTHYQLKVRAPSAGSWLRCLQQPAHAPLCTAEHVAQRDVDIRLHHLAPSIKRLHASAAVGWGHPVRVSYCSRAARSAQVCSRRCSLCHRHPCATSGLCTLQAHLRGEHLPFRAVELDEVVSQTAGASRELGLVEREVTAYWTAEFFRQQRERDANQTWTALLLQWIRVVRQRKQLQGSGQPQGARCSWLSLAPGSCDHQGRQPAGVDLRVCSSSSLGWHHNRLCCGPSMPSSCHMLTSRLGTSFVRQGMHLTDTGSPMRQSSPPPIIHLQPTPCHAHADQIPCCACRSLAWPGCCCRTLDWRLSCALIVPPAQAMCWVCAASLWTSPPAGEQAGACGVCCEEGGREAGPVCCMSEDVHVWAL